MVVDANDPSPLPGHAASGTECTAAPIRYVYTSEFRAGRDPRNLTLRDRLASFTYFPVLCIVNMSRDLWLFLARRYTRKKPLCAW